MLILKFMSSAFYFDKARGSPCVSNPNTPKRFMAPHAPNNYALMKTKITVVI